MGMLKWYSHLQPLKKLELPYDPGIPLLSIYPREMKTHIHAKLVHECHSSSTNKSQETGHDPYVQLL